jgi:hypothetical protein
VNGLCIDVPMERTAGLRERLAQVAGPKVSVRGYGIEADQIAVLRSEEPFAAIQLMGSHGGNYNIWPEDIIARFTVWDDRFGLLLTGAGDDWVEAAFKRQPADMLAFAKEVYAFCPDVVEQGTETLSVLAKEMAASNHVFLWWD